MNKPIYHNLSTSKVFKILKTKPEGLSKTEVKKRQKKYGLNILPKKKRMSSLKIFLNQFKSLLIIILIIASLISFAIGEKTDSLIIFLAIMINALIGFLQENKAEKTLQRLKQMVEYTAKVRRNNKETVVKSKELVKGDIVILESGDIVPADGRVIKSHHLQVVEAILTGESSASIKITDPLPTGTPLADRENMVYKGTRVIQGKGEMVVTATGLETEIGAIASTLKKTKEEKTPLQKKTDKLAKMLGGVIITICILLFALGVARGYPLPEMFITSVAVAVAGVPEGLVIAVTVCLIIGVQRMLKQKALIRKIIAAETLGSVTTIVSDKTGTLTEGKMSVVQILPTKGKQKQEIISAGVLCNNAIIENESDELKKVIIRGDETDQSLLLSSIQLGIQRKEILSKFPRLDEIPFDPEKKFMATLHKSSEEKTNIIILKGAPETVLNFCSIDTEEKKQITQTVNSLTKKGLRILAFAEKRTNREELDEIPQNFKYLGLVALKDPLRQGVKQVIQACYSMGIKIILATGDHRFTAQAIAIEAGLKTDQIIEGKDMEKMSDEELKKTLKSTPIFTRIEPKHKLRIVQVLKELKEVVAVTGDGVNDALAIKKADIGIALGSGTEVTKETADIVLLDDNFKTILSAIEQGKLIFQNIKKVILYLLASSFSEIILIGACILMGQPLPILANQVIWVNLVEDSLPALSLSKEKERSNILSKKEQKKSLLDKEIKTLIIIITIVNNLTLLFLFNYFLKSPYFTLEHIRSFMLIALGIDSLFYIYSCKDLRKNIWHYNPFDNMLLNISVILGLIMLACAVYIPFLQKILKTVPLNLFDWIFLICIGLLNMILIETGKIFFIPKNKKINSYGILKRH